MKTTGNFIYIGDSLAEVDEVMDFLLSNTCVKNSERNLIDIKWNRSTQLVCSDKPGFYKRYCFPLRRLNTFVKPVANSAVSSKALMKEVETYTISIPDFFKCADFESCDSVLLNRLDVSEAFLAIFLAEVIKKDISNVYVSAFDEPQMDGALCSLEVIEEMQASGYDFVASYTRDFGDSLLFFRKNRLWQENIYFKRKLERKDIEAKALKKQLFSFGELGVSLKENKNMHKRIIGLLNDFFDEYRPLDADGFFRSFESFLNAIDKRNEEYFVSSEKKFKNFEIDIKNKIISEFYKIEKNSFGRVEFFKNEISNHVEETKKQSEYHANLVNKVAEDVAKCLDAVERTPKLINGHSDNLYNNLISRSESFINLFFSVNSNFKPIVFRDWSLSSDMAFLYYELMLSDAYDLVVEFGSGSSTFLALDAAMKVPNVKVVSFEHEEVFYKKTKEKLTEACEDHEKYVELCKVKLQETNAENEKINFYDCDEILKKYLVLPKKKILVLVDGPPGSLSEKSRSPAFFKILKYFKESEIHFLVDDYRRKGEFEMVEAWKKFCIDNFLQHELITFSFEKGAALFKVNLENLDV